MTLVDMVRASARRVEPSGCGVMEKRDLTLDRSRKGNGFIGEPRPTGVTIEWRDR